MSVEKYGKFEKPPALFDPLSEARDVWLELVGHGVDVLRVALARLRQLGSGCQQFLGISVSVLKKIIEKIKMIVELQLPQ